MTRKSFSDETVDSVSAVVLILLVVAMAVFWVSHL